MVFEKKIHYHLDRFKVHFSPGSRHVVHREVPDKNAYLQTSGALRPRRSFHEAYLVQPENMDHRSSSRPSYQCMRDMHGREALCYQHLLGDQ